MAHADPPYIQLLERYRLAIALKDLNLLMPLYADDIVVFDPFGHWSIVGMDAWRAAMHQWLQDLADRMVGVEYTRPRATLMLLHTTLTFTEYDADGNALRSIDNRCTLAARQEFTDWQFFHQHSSLPVHESSMQAILHAPPV